MAIFLHPISSSFNTLFLISITFTIFCYFFFLLFFFFFSSVLLSPFPFCIFYILFTFCSHIFDILQIYLHFQPFSLLTPFSSISPPCFFFYLGLTFLSNFLPFFYYVFFFSHFDSPSPISLPFLLPVSHFLSLLQFATSNLTQTRPLSSCTLKCLFCFTSPCLCVNHRVV